MARSPRSSPHTPPSKRGGAPVKRTFRTVKAGELTASVAAPVLSRRGLPDTVVLRHWPEVVGPRLAAHCLPERLERPRNRSSDGGTLHVKVRGGAAAMELQASVPQVIDRVNRVLGHRAVSRIRMVQGPLPQPKPRPVEPPPLSATGRRALHARLDGVEDAEMRQALERLGASILRRGR